MKLNNVTKRYGSTTVLQACSLTLPDRGVIAFYGPSGCGKTTLLRLLTSLEKPDSGTLTVPFHRVSHVFQEDRLFLGISAAKNLALVAPHGEEILRQMGLSEHMHEKVGQLSGGMQRRVALARALAFGGDAYALDEPFKGLDLPRKKEIMAMFRAEAAQKPVLFITHDEEELSLFADTVVRFAGPPLQQVQG